MCVAINIKENGLHSWEVAWEEYVGHLEDIWGKREEGNLSDSTPVKAYLKSKKIKITTKKQNKTYIAKNPQHNNQSSAN